MHMYTSTPLKKIVADLIHTSNKFITINYVKMQYQTGTSDCGLFAIAAACPICHGQDPGQLKYKQEAMRAYLLEAFDDMTHLEPFPSASYLRTQTTRIESKEVPVYCSCRLPNDGSGMVQCSIPARSGTIYVVWVFHWRQKNAGTVNSVLNYACHVIYLIT